MTNKRPFPRRVQRSAIAGAVSLVFLAGMAHAQTNTTGNVYGSVAPAAGQTIVVENVNTGLKRTLTPDASGRFTASSLPTGTYKVTLLRDGKVVSVQEKVEVLIGQGSEVVFAGVAAQTIQITGRLGRLDMSSTTGGATFTSAQLDSLPIGKSIDSIILLAPNTTRADPRYANNAVSFGGGAPSENSYYINGFPVTNALNQLGSSQLPFAAIAQAQILTGGFGAEFGRSIGGVANITTKSGTNTWQGGVSLSVAPNSMRSQSKDIMYPETGANPATDGKIYLARAQNTRTTTSLSAYASGPLIQDKLVMFLAVEQNKDNRGTVALTSASGNNASGWAERKNTNNRYLAKFDFNITNDHILEATLIGDRYYQEEELSGYSYTDRARFGDVRLRSNYTNAADHNLGVGSSAKILRYTGFMTKDLTVSALIGSSKSPHVSSYGGADVNNNVLRQVAVPSATNTMPGQTYVNPYPFAAGTFVIPAGSNDKVEAQRLDIEYRLGTDHTIRGGLDTVKLKSAGAGDRYAGGGVWSYLSSTNGNLRPNGKPSATDPSLSLIEGGAVVVGGRYYYAREQIFLTVTDAQSTQAAQYIEDVWQVTKGLKITPGLRFEQYKNKNGDGETFLEVKNQINPRFSFSWDATGDGATKVFGSAGRYGVQIPTHLAVRGASRSTFTRQFFAYSGVDANGAPTGRTALGLPFSANNEYGQAKDAKVVSAQDMKPNSQDELMLGIERSLSPSLNVGARVTYRKLVNTIDDLCDARPFEKFASDNGIDTTNWGGFGCASFNPGKANRFLVDFGTTTATKPVTFQGKYAVVDLSAADLGFEKAKRTYFALDFFAERPMKDGWGGKISYTYSKNKGNTEGQTLSDVGQTDVAATQTWDHPELMVGAYGYLPNDRRHQIKAFGTLRVLPELDVGGVLTMSSGRPKNCLGNFVSLDANGNPLPGSGTPSHGTSAEDFENFYSYGSSYRRCSFDGGNTVTSVPRGSAGTLPWDRSLDLNLVYRPKFAKGLTLRADVFNVFNKQSILAVDETHEAAGDPSTIVSTYGRVLSYSSARSVRLTASYDF